MKTTNQTKLDKAIQLLLLVVLDFSVAYFFMELVLSISNASFTLKSLPYLFFFLGFAPFVVVQHLKNVPKHIEIKLTYIFVFSTCVLIVFIFLCDFFKHGFVGVMDGIFNLTVGILYTLLGISMFIKLFLTIKKE